MRFVGHAAVMLLAALVPASHFAGNQTASAQLSAVSQAGFQAYLPTLRAQALQAGVSRETVDRIIPTLTFSPRTIELDRAQPGAPLGSPAITPYAPYRTRHLTQSLINRGRARYGENIALLNDISRQYGVPANVIIAIWGKETSYGTITGNFDLLNSLASLAYEGRRRELFTTEFIATLKMIDQGVPRSRLQGSWAGATGYPQFLPSVYMRLGVDWDRSGYSDIWQSRADTFASIANYFSKAGWKPNVPWGIPVAVPANFNRQAVVSRLESPRCPRVHQRHSRWMTIGEWRSMGITSLSGQWPDGNEMASLIEPDGPGQTAYLATTNYRTILDYNCSNFYALTVGLLADGIAR
jgi:membrane-bound lytic murein transglycosylase B